MSTKRTFCKHVAWSMAALFVSLGAVGFAQSVPAQSAGAPTAGAGATAAGATTAGAVTAGTAGASTASNASTAAPTAANGEAKPAPPSEAISPGQAVYLVRSTLMMLNDANRSGNYTVLRDLAAPNFQARNSPADLAQSFADLRRRSFDLFAAALLAPQFTAGPALDGNGRLRLAGFFHTTPLRITFDLTFQSVAGEWRLLAVSVATPPAPATHSRLEHPGRRLSGLFYGVQVLSGTAGWRW
jgi:hypothetical protein